MGGEIGPSPPRFCNQTATDIDDENGPMVLLAQNIAANCCRTERATSSATKDADDPQKDRQNEAYSPDILRARETSVVGNDAREMIYSPRVHGLRWGDKTQLEEALKIFDGCGPDVVLA